MSETATAIDHKCHHVTNTLMMTFLKGLSDAFPGKDLAELQQYAICIAKIVYPWTERLDRTDRCIEAIIQTQFGNLSPEEKLSKIGNLAIQESLIDRQRQPKDMSDIAEAREAYIRSFIPR